MNGDRWIKSIRFRKAGVEFCSTFHNLSLGENFYVMSALLEQPRDYFHLQIGGQSQISDDRAPEQQVRPLIRGDIGNPHLWIPAASRFIRQAEGDQNIV